MKNSSLFFLGYLYFLLLAISALGQSQQQWVKKYSLVSSATNQATAIVLAPDGNLIVAGTSASTNGDLEYVAIKYSPGGQQMWVTRYDSPTNGQNLLRGMAVDSAGNAILTGTSKTVSVGTNGAVLWSAPFAGRALAADTNGNSYVVGFSELDFVTAQLDRNGSNVWLNSFSYITSTNVPDISQTIAIGSNGLLAVAGTETHFLFENGSYLQFKARAYSLSGFVYWGNHAPIAGTEYCSSMEIVSVAVDKDGRVGYLGNFCGGFSFATRCYAPTGTVQWSWVQDTDLGILYGGSARAMAFDFSGAVIATGSRYYGELLCTYKIGTNGHKIWLATYHGPGAGQNQATALALDSAGNTYVTGYSPGSASGNDIVTLKYDPNGNQLWVQRYNGPANADDFGCGIVLDGKGAVYVTGYSATTNGGTEFVTIKYLERPSLSLPQERSDRNFQFQLNSWIGATNVLESSSNLVNWSAVTNIVVTNVPMPVVDLGASNSTTRYYRVRWP